MKKLLLAGALMALAAGTATAGETGIINQAGPYEATMQFYLHPAHGFPGVPESSAPTVTSDGAEGKAKLAARTRNAGTHPQAGVDRAPARKSTAAS